MFKWVRYYQNHCEFLKLHIFILCFEHDTLHKSKTCVQQLIFVLAGRVGRKEPGVMITYVGGKQPKTPEIKQFLDEVFFL